MVKPIRLIKKGLTFLALGSFSLLLAACYGSYALFSSIAVTVKDKASGAAIPDIKLSLTDASGTVMDSASTDETGMATLNYAPSTSDAGEVFTVTATDIDGDANGTYAEQSQPVSAESQSLGFEL